MEEIVTKVSEAPPSGEATAAPPADQGARRDIRVRVSAKTVGGQKKRAEVWTQSQGRPWGSRFAILCDEGVAIGGEDTAPPPLAYFSAGVAF